MPNLRPLVAEMIGTFFLCFAGIGAIVSTTYRAGSIDLLGIAAAHGIALAVAVSATMKISGGHCNPAITLGLLSIGRVSARTAVQYVLAQLAGALLAALAIKGLYPTMAGVVSRLGTPALAADVSILQGIVIEAILTFMLAFAVMGTAVDPSAPKVGGMAIGLTLFFAILAGGQMTGGALNPARAFGPALVANSWLGHIVFWIGPILGSVLACQVYQRVLLKPEAAA